MADSNKSIISVFVAVFVAIILFLAAYIFGWTPAPAEIDTFQANDEQNVGQ